MTLYLATTNSNKIKEIKEILQKLFEVKKENSVFKIQTLKGLFDIKSLESLENYSPPEEKGLSFKDNALIKSECLLNYLRNREMLESFSCILAEDSGLEVDCLNGAPGVYSARYSGLESNDEKNNKLLLKNLRGQNNRSARYVCVLSFLLCRQKEVKSHIFSAVCEGAIAKEEKAKGGFGYDPLFIPDGETKTFAELPKEFKQSISHRRKALEIWAKSFIKWTEL